MFGERDGGTLKGLGQSSIAFELFPVQRFRNVMTERSLPVDF